MNCGLLSTCNRSASVRPVLLQLKSNRSLLPTFVFSACCQAAPLPDAQP
jgi:hypothetical protein